MCGGALPWWKEEFDKDKEGDDKNPDNTIPSEENEDSCG
jgi:hypothetical protein